jgi:hypothetical protein
MGLLTRKHGGASHTHGGDETRGQLLDRGWRYEPGGLVLRHLPRSGEGPGTTTEGARRGPASTRRIAPRRGMRHGDPRHRGRCPAGTDRPGGGDRSCPRQIARARSKARRAGAPVEFEIGAIEDLPFPDGSFDVVTSTLMLHHLPEGLRRRGLDEIAGVLKPSGHVVVADFDTASRHGATGEPSAVEHLPELLAVGRPHDRWSPRHGLPPASPRLVRSHHHVGAEVLVGSGGHARGEPVADGSDAQIREASREKIEQCATLGTSQVSGSSDLGAA